jgi:glycosyltransferase involved in cell wall biosynthesis
VKFSIITINLNNKAGLTKTIESVIHQTYTDFEYIVIDGDSRDGSKAVIQQYQDKIDYWVSEPDAGIYQAMNKGIKVAQGEFLLFLNSGDWLMQDNALSNVIKLLSEEDVICSCDIILCNDTSSVTKEAPNEIRMVGFLDDFYLPHQSTFIHRSAFDKCGLYKEEYRFVSDWIFFIEVLVINNQSYRRLPLPLTYFDTNGVSCQAAFHEAILSERTQALQALFPKILIEDFILLREERNQISSTRFELLKKIEKSRFGRRILQIFMMILKFFI